MDKYCLYVIGPRGGPLKIGITQNVHSRRIELNIGNPAYLRIHHHEVFDTEKDASRFESELHFHYRDSHIRGEWFALNEDDIPKIRQLLGSLLRFIPTDLTSWSLERKACDEFTPSVCARARRALGWSVDTLAKESDLNLQTVTNFEANVTTPHLGTVEALKATLEDAGVTFLSEAPAKPLRVLI